MVYNTGERKDMAGDLERTVSHKAVLLFYFPCVLCVVDCVSVSQLFQLGVECTLEKEREGAMALGNISTMLHSLEIEPSERRTMSTSSGAS